MSLAVPATHQLQLDGVGPVSVDVTTRGDGHPIFLVHGGAGPRSMATFADLLADRGQARVIAPTHPGFDGTTRPTALASVRQLAQLYVSLIDELDLTDVTVVGNSIGGWIAAEIALLGSARIARLVLLDATGIDVPGHPVADIAELSQDEVMQLSFHDPSAFRIDVSTLPPAAREVADNNRKALAVYGGPVSADETLRDRLAQLDLPTLVVWGDSDQIVDVDYGRAYAAAIAGAELHLLSETGHVPQLETPLQVLPFVSAFIAAHPSVAAADAADG